MVGGTELPACAFSVSSQLPLHLPTDVRTSTGKTMAATALIKIGTNMPLRLPSLKLPDYRGAFFIADELNKKGKGK